VICEVLTVASMELTGCWYITSYHLVEIDRRCRGSCCFRHQDDENFMMETVNTSETSVNFYEITRHKIQKYSHHTRSRESLKPYSLCKSKAATLPSCSRQGERKNSSYSLLTSALDGLSCQSHVPAALYPRGKDILTNWIGGWVGLRAGLNTEARGKITFLHRRTKPDRPFVHCSQTLYWLSYPKSLMHYE
jgi:hypothetical protein